MVPQPKVAATRPMDAGREERCANRARKGALKFIPPESCLVPLAANAAGTAKISNAVVTAMSVLMSIQRSATPAIDGPRKKPACIENVNQPMARPRRLPDVDSVTALNSAACCAPPANPPTICQRNNGAMLGVNAVAICDPPASANDRPSRALAPNPSPSTPDGRETKPPARVATENSAPTSNLLAPRSCAYSGTVSPRAARAAKDAPAAT